MTTQTAAWVNGIPAIKISGGDVAMTGMQSMASKMWAPFIVMGLMIVVTSLVLGFVVSSMEASYYANSKEVRDAAVAGSDIAVEKGTIEAMKQWVPGFKFMGLGFMLGGITFLLATILGNLRVAGGKAQKALGVDQLVIKKPMIANFFPMLMMMGLMTLITTFVISIVLATMAASYWDNSIATVLNPATPGGTGDSLLADIGSIKAINAWLTPLKFVGMALLFNSIALALVTIVKVLRFQASRLVEVAQQRS
jgi:hypothetical protein